MKKIKRKRRFYSALALQIIAVATLLLLSTCGAEQETTQIKIAFVGDLEGYLEECG